ncbi:hypothetical protein [Hoyosella altamirensis]|uniref:Uncharacterized protein n=1 Tax=Hoyosella altamirensis TaxID=616997 RepID=A0A839RG69_9ACTN|nr:hypothetical protein [Hoyosella altamirensis]MBB3035712.1 hypothetical protein [Hoyosella altamirensis]
MARRVVFVFRFIAFVVCLAFADDGGDGSASRGRSSSLSVMSSRV